MYDDALLLDMIMSIEREVEGGEERKGTQGRRDDIVSYNMLMLLA